MKILFSHNLRSLHDFNFKPVYIFQVDECFSMKEFKNHPVSYYVCIYGIRGHMDMGTWLQI